MADAPVARSIVVFMGGWSPEREVSLVSGAAAAAALRALGHGVREVDVTRDLAALLAALTPRPDLVFNALHGIGGEDGVIQSILEVLEVPVTHSGRLASAVAMDKPTTKRIAAGLGVPVADQWIGPLTQVRHCPPMERPFVVKPIASGSSCGVTLVFEPHDLAAMNGPDEVVMVERYIPGRELTVAVLERRGAPPEALGVTELRPAEGFYNYHAKYTQGATLHLVPAPVPDEVAWRVRSIAETVHMALGCRGLTRCDFRWDDSRPGTDGIVFLEINTQPGLTPLSLAPEQAAAIGMSFETLVQHMVEAAL